MSPSRLQMCSSDRSSNKSVGKGSVGDLLYPFSMVGKNVYSIHSSRTIENVSLLTIKSSAPPSGMETSPSVSKFSLPPPDLTKLSPEKLNVYELVVPFLHSAIEEKKATKQVLDSVMEVFFPEDAVPVKEVPAKVSRSLRHSVKTDTSALPVDPMKLENWRSKPKTATDKENNRVQSTEVDDELTVKILDLSLGKGGGRNPVLKPSNYFRLNMEMEKGDRAISQTAGPFMCKLCFGTDHPIQNCPLYSFAAFSMAS